MSAASNHPEYSPGLAGVIAGISQISEIDTKHSNLTYRGINVHELAEKATYEETVYLLLHYKLPNEHELHFFKDRLIHYRTVPSQALEAMRLLKETAHPMEVLRAGYAVAASYDTHCGQMDHRSNLSKAERIVAIAPTLVAASWRFGQGLPMVESDPTLSHAANFLYMLTGEKPDEFKTRVMDVVMTLYAEHSFNASAFACRVTVSTLSDIYSGVISAIGTLKGPLHGGANEAAMNMLLEIDNPNHAEQWIRDALAQRKLIMGFGHREYKSGDSRAFYLSRLAKEVAERLGETKWTRIAEILERVMLEEKGLYPNVDFPVAYALYMLGISPRLYTPIFAMARTAGWCAHAIEQLDNNKLIRPTCIYEGRREVPVVDISERL